MRYKFKLDGEQYDVQTTGLDHQPGDGSVVLRTYDTETLKRFLGMFADEFRKLQENKKMTDLMIERIVDKNNKFRDFHFHLDVIHELWLRGIIA